MENFPVEVKVTSVILLLLFCVGFTGSGEQGIVADARTSETLLEVSMEDGISVGTPTDGLNEVERIFKEDNLKIGVAGILPILPTHCSSATATVSVKAEASYCQACTGVGAHSQIGVGTDQVTFYAYSFPQPSGGCYANSPGTVTFEYEVTDNDTGQEITSGSVQRSFGGSASCYPYEYAFSSYSYTNDFTLPLPGFRTQRLS